MPTWTGVRPENKVLIPGLSVPRHGKFDQALRLDIDCLKNARYCASLILHCLLLVQLYYNRCMTRAMALWQVLSTRNLGKHSMYFTRSCSSHTLSRTIDSVVLLISWSINSRNKCGGIPTHQSILSELLFSTEPAKTVECFSKSLNLCTPWLRVVLTSHPTNSSWLEIHQMIKISVRQLFQYWDVWSWISSIYWCDSSDLLVCVIIRISEIW